MMLFSAEAILASSTSKLGIEILRIDDEALNSSTESTISTSLIHCIASVGGFVTLCAPAARVVQASHSGVGPYRATSCFRMYLCLCCGVLTIASGIGIITAGTWRWSHLGLFSDEHPRNSSAFSDEFVVPLLVCGFPLKSRTSQQSTF